MKVLLQCIRYNKDCNNPSARNPGSEPCVLIKYENTIIVEGFQNKMIT